MPAFRPFLLALLFTAFLASASSAAWYQEHQNGNNARATGISVSPSSFVVPVHAQGKMYLTPAGILYFGADRTEMQISYQGNVVSQRCAGKHLSKDVRVDEQGRFYKLLKDRVQRFELDSAGRLTEIWKSPSYPWAKDLIVFDDRVWIYAELDKGTPGVAVLSAETGEPLLYWSGANHRDTRIAPHHNALVATFLRDVLAYDLELNLLWQLRISEMSSEAVAVDDERARVYFSTMSDIRPHFYALDLKTGAVVNKKYIPREFSPVYAPRVSGLAVTPSGDLALAVHSGGMRPRVFTLGVLSADLEYRWHVDLGQPAFVSAPVALPDGTVALLHTTGNECVLTRHEAARGETLNQWRWPAPTNSTTALREQVHGPFGTRDGLFVLDGRAVRAFPFTPRSS